MNLGHFKGLKSFYIRLKASQKRIVTIRVERLALINLVGLIVSSSFDLRLFVVREIRVEGLASFGVNYPNLLQKHTLRDTFVAVCVRATFQQA